MKLPCRSCGKMIMPYTAEANRGLCIPCVGKECFETLRFFVTEGIGDNCPTALTEADLRGETAKLPCLYCGRPILPTTARDTGGYCLPHSRPGFLRSLGGTAIFSKAYSQHEVWEHLMGQNLQQPLGLLFSIMSTGDCLKLFHVKPDRSLTWFAARGVACFRGGLCISGFVITWEKIPPNPPGFFFKMLEEWMP